MAWCLRTYCVYIFTHWSYHDPELLGYTILIPIPNQLHLQINAPIPDDIWCPRLFFIQQRFLNNVGLNAGWVNMVNLIRINAKKWIGSVIWIFLILKPIEVVRVLDSMPRAQLVRPESPHGFSKTWKMHITYPFLTSVKVWPKKKTSVKVT